MADLIVIVMRRGIRRTVADLIVTVMRRGLRPTYSSVPSGPPMVIAVSTRAYPTPICRESWVCRRSTTAIAVGWFGGAGALQVLFTGRST